jgi:hypothetical protein
MFRGIATAPLKGVRDSDGRYSHVILKSVAFVLTILILISSHLHCS